MVFGGFEQREHRPAAVGGNLKRASLEAARPEVEPGDRLEAEVLGVPPRRLRSVGHANVHVSSRPIRNFGVRIDGLFSVNLQVEVSCDVRGRSFGILTGISSQMRVFS
jgi:hypothetical protein